MSSEEYLNKVLACPKCYHTGLSRSGFDKYKQRYQCGACKHRTVNPIEDLELVEENVKKWIEDSLGQDGLDKIKRELETMIEHQIDPPTAEGLPW